VNGDTAHYFQTLFAGRPPGSLIAVSSAARGFKADCYDEPTAAASGCAGAVDVYARVTPLRERPRSRGRGDAGLAAALLGLWVELDVRGTPNGRGGVKADGFDSIEHALEVGAGVIEPTMTIASGGGAHLYVVLAEPFVIATAEDLEHAETLVRRYQHAIRRAAGGIPIDSTHDLARVLRPPGTFNGKGAEPRPVEAIANGQAAPVALEDLESVLPALDDSTGARLRAARRKIAVDEEVVARVLVEHPGLDTLVARTGADPSADDFALACAAAREDLAPKVIEELVAYRLVRHGDPKGKAGRTDYAPRTVERALAVEARARREALLGDPLADASAIIGMQEVPIVAAEEQRGGRIVLERADDRMLHAPSLEALAKYDRLVAALAAGFGHKLTVAKGKGAGVAADFVSALRRHFGPGRVRALEVKLAHDTATGDRYLRSGWAQEYVRRCGWRGSVEQVAGLLEAVGLEQPNPSSGGRVKARWRAGGETVVLRFWVIPRQRYEEWRS
jgi:hypothetical protein